MHFRGIALAALVLLCGCESTLETCYRGGDWGCVAHQCQRNGASRDCDHHKAKIRFDQALSDRTSPLPDVEVELNKALKAMTDATGRRGRRDFEEQDRQATKALEDFKGDHGSVWHERVEQAPSADLRMKAALDHRDFYAQRGGCRHLVREEARQYVRNFDGLPLSEMRSALHELENTTLADDLFEQYVRHRLRARPGREFEILRDIRSEFDQTPYASLADERIETEFNERSGKERDPRRLEQICPEAPDPSRRVDCEQHVSDLWLARAERTGSTHELKEICEQHLTT